MDQYLIYIIPVIVVAIVFVYGFSRSRKAMPKHMAAAGTSTDGQTDEPKHSGVYEKPGVNQQSDHPLGAVQSVIRGRIRFTLFGLGMIAVALFGLYMVYISGFGAEIMETFGGRTPLNILIVTVLMLGAVIWGLQLLNFATYRIKLRRTGFEMSSMLGTKTYEYKDVSFYLDRTVEHKQEADGYRPIVLKADNYNFIWVCQVLFHDGRKPVIIKSSRYAWLRQKMTALIDALNKEL